MIPFNYGSGSAKAKSNGSYGFGCATLSLHTISAADIDSPYL
jgi:hypothetical protein